MEDYNRSLELNQPRLWNRIYNQQVHKGSHKGNNNKSTIELTQSYKKYTGNNFYQHAAISKGMQQGYVHYTSNIPNNQI